VGRGFAHYDDYPISLREVFTRYIGLGRKLDRFSIALLLDKLLGGRGVDAEPLIPISLEHVKPASEINQAFLKWLSWQRGRARPFFAFLNFNDAHTPYEVPDATAAPMGLRPASWHDRLKMEHWTSVDKNTLTVRDVQLGNDVYDDCIAYLDRRLGDLLEELRGRGLLDDTIVVVTSDHGEHLGDHMLFFHGCSLYRQLVQVPLVIAGPTGVPGGRAIDEPVSLRDLPATILDLLGLERAGAFPGRSFADLWDRDRRTSRAARDPLLMETDTPNLLANQGREPVAKGPMKSLVAGGFHYIRSADGTEELFDLKGDPEETVNAAIYPDAATSLEGFRGALRSMLSKRPPVSGARTAELAPSRIGND
jgi:arylsulfatase A-like enzyme